MNSILPKQSIRWVITGADIDYPELTHGEYDIWAATEEEAIHAFNGLMALGVYPPYKNDRVKKIAVYTPSSIRAKSITRWVREH